MKKLLLFTVFVLSTLAWAVAQDTGGKPGTGGQSASSQSSNQGSASQSQSPANGAGQTTPGASSQTTPGSAGQTGATAQSQMANAPITEGCLGGSKAAYTITDKAGKTYKLNIPANADASPLASHIGESVMVLGNVSSGGGSPSIDVEKIGRGTGNCSGSSSSAPQPH